MLLNVAADSLYHVLPWIFCQGAWSAAQAFTETGALGLVNMTKERYILATRTLRRAGRPAVDAGRRHGINEFAVARAIAGENGLPAGIISQVRHFYLARSFCQSGQYRTVHDARL